MIDLNGPLRCDHTGLTKHTVFSARIRMKSLNLDVSSCPGTPEGQSTQPLTKLRARQTSSLIGSWTRCRLLSDWVSRSEKVLPRSSSMSNCSRKTTSQRSWKVVTSFGSLLPILLVCRSDLCDLMSLTSQSHVTPSTMLCLTSFVLT